jgi:hypothetical protein
MTDLRHEVPTHLGAEDKPLLGLAMHQLTYLLVGFSVAYAAWNQWPELPLAARLALALASLAAAAVVALVRPCGRGLDDWVFVLLRAAGVPKRSAWHPRQPDPASWRAAGTAWADLAPRPEASNRPVGQRAATARRPEAGR